VASAGVNDFAEPSKIVGRSDAGTVVPGNVVHGAVEYFRILGMQCEVSEGISHSEHLLEPSLAGFDGVEQFSPRLPEER
jgi:hypothetical protein